MHYAWFFLLKYVIFAVAPENVGLKLIPVPAPQVDCQAELFIDCHSTAVYRGFIPVVDSMLFHVQMCSQNNQYNWILILLLYILSYSVSFTQKHSKASDYF